MTEPDDMSFNEAGDRFSLHKPRLIEKADFDLWNDMFCVKGDHTGRVEGNVFTPNAQPYAESPRPVYAVDRESAGLWSFTWGPVFRDPQVFSFDIHPDHLSWLQEYRGIASEVSLSIPRDHCLEAWNLKVSNHRPTSARLSIVPAFPTGLLGLLSHESALAEAEAPFGLLHNYFPYYVRIPDYGKMARRWNTTFFFTDKAPDSWTALERDFLGFTGWQSPEALGKGNLGLKHCHYERGICAAAYTIHLEPGESFGLDWIFGPAKSAEHAREVAGACPPGGAFARAVESQRCFRKGWTLPLRIESPDTDFNHYINLWSPDRSIRIGRTFRFNPSPQARNAIQDTMTLGLFDPDTARERFKAIWRHQEADGFMPHGLPMVPDAELMPITLIPHKDTNVWGPVALDVYLRETNDLEFLEEPVAYTDGSEASLAEHLEAGLRWLLRERSPRGLSLIGQGDWNDPLNMAGPGGKGESIWLSEALVYALETWAGICGRRGKDGSEWRTAAGECRSAIREHAWDGKWFLRAISDDGTRIGSHENQFGRIFLNAQSWALMAGIADAEQEQAILDSVREHLDTPLAPAMLAPAYPGMAKHVGKLTLKSPGTGENGSIYSHAALFWSYALYQLGHAGEGWRVLRNLLPGGPGNPVESAGQIPLYIPNFYRGPASPDVFGRSSHSPNTGSAAWVYLIFLENVVGLKGNGDGLLIQPRIPAEWAHVKGERRFRGTTYRYDIRREPGLEAVAVEVDGQPAETGIPWKPSTDPVKLRIRVP